MAIGSVLNPEKIVGKQNINQKLAKNFISGDSFLGTSSIASAANKIVGFQRGTTKPVPSSVDSIVSTISTNITNNITSTLNNTLQSFTTDYKKRVSDVDSAKPTGILSKFLSTYKSVIQFIQFFGNKKFVNGISDNLKNLSKSFTESFEVAKLIRQVIVKIVQQLSNLPKASPGGGGGIDIDVDVPMGGVRKSAPRGLGNMFKGRGKMLALGAGALGLGAVGAGTVNALSNVDEIRAGMFQPGDGGDIISTFGSVIERFIAAINTMVGIGKGSKPPGGGGGGGSPGGGGGGGGGGGKMGSPVDYSNLKSGDISTMAGKSAVLYDEYRNLGYTDEGAKRLIAEIGREGGMDNKNLFGTHTDPSAKIPNTGMFSWNQDRRTALIDQAKKAGVWDETKGQIKETAEGLRFQARFSANEIKTRGAGVPEALTTQGYSGAKISQLLRDKYVVYRTDRGYSGGPDSEYGSVKTGEWYKKLTPGLEKTYKPKTGVGGPDLPDYMLPPETRDQYKNLATNVSQPAQSAVQSQTNIVPIDLSGAMPQQSQGGGGGVSAPPSTQKNGPSVPLLPSANTDNFLVLYSRMVYNIVDG
jgi:hypothetical protein